jgi:riboflavin kinase / FMN adenylyltransferase
LPPAFQKKLKIYKDISEVNLEKPVATIGIFDGVHLAHKAILKKLLEVSNEIGGESLIVTLWPHPRIILQAGNDPVKLITTLDEKIEILERSGVQNLLILDFNTDISQTGFDDFVRKYLVENLKIKHLVVGYNHHFGKNREGNFEKLQPLSRIYGFGLEQLPPVIIDNQKISSSIIRKFIEAGDVKSANNCLGHIFSVTGQVVGGSKIGREMGFPTANLQISDPYKLIPAIGVYAVAVEIMPNVYKNGMMNIGFRPTLENTDKIKTLEVNIFDFHEDLYNKTIKIWFVERIRDEEKFKNLDELKTQLEKDRIKSIQILSDLKINYL